MIVNDEFSQLKHLNDPPLDRPRIDSLQAIQWIAASIIFATLAASLMLGAVKQWYFLKQEPIETNFSPEFSVVVMLACLLLAFSVPRLIFLRLKRELKRGRRHLRGTYMIFTPVLFLRYTFFVAIAIFGFVVTLPDRDLTSFLPFIFISLGLMVLNFPTKNRIRRWTRKIGPSEEPATPAAL